MKKVRSICIIHRQEDNAPAVFCREFMKWIGLAYFDFIYHESDDGLNSVLNHGNNHFDIILYINDSDRFWEKRYAHFSDLNISVELHDIWSYVDKNIPDQKPLLDIWREIGLKYIKSADCEKVFLEIIGKLIDVYCQNDLFRKLFNNRFTIWKEESPEKEYRTQLQNWMKAVSEMEQWKMNHSVYKDTEKYVGMEYFEYALLNSQRKVNEICDFLEARKAFDTKSLLERAEDIYLLDDGFYMIECLRAKTARIDYMYRTMAVSIDKVCINDCNIDTCNSFNYYRLGKLYESNRRREQSYKLYMTSYNKNNLNFRAVFKLAVERIKKEDPSGAQSMLLEILKILQVSSDDKTCGRTFRSLPPLELEYVCKCYVLLGNIETDFYSNNVNAAYYYQQAVNISEYVEINDFLRKIYPLEEDLNNVKKCLVTRLSLNSIKKKLAFCQRNDREQSGD